MEEDASALYKKTKKRWDDISFTMKYVYWWLKSSCFEFFGGQKCGVFESKSWWKYDIYWLRKSSCFDLFGNGKYGLFLSQEVDGKMLFTEYWKVLVLNFLVIENAVFFESRSWWKGDIYWLMRSSCFELYGDRKYGLFFRQKVDEKMIYTWFFWAFHDIPEPGKYGFSCRDGRKYC